MSMIIVLRTEEMLDEILACLKVTDFKDVEELIRKAVQKALSDYESVSNKTEANSFFGVQFEIPRLSSESVLSDSGEWTSSFSSRIIQYNLLALRLLSLFQKENIPMTINPVNGEKYCPYVYDCVIYGHIHLTSSTSHPLRTGQCPP